MRSVKRYKIEIDGYYSEDFADFDAAYYAGLKFTFLNMLKNNSSDFDNITKLTRYLITSGVRIRVAGVENTLAVVQILYDNIDFEYFPHYYEKLYELCTEKFMFPFTIKQQIDGDIARVNYMGVHVANIFPVQMYKTSSGYIEDKETADRFKRELERVDGINKLVDTVKSCLSTNRYSALCIRDLDIQAVAMILYDNFNVELSEKRDK